MKKTKTTPETTVAKAKVEKTVAPKVNETVAKTATVDKAVAKPAEIVAPKPKTEQAVVAAIEETAKKPAAAKASPKKTKAPAPKPAAVTSELAVSERVGLTAGAIWNYLSANGATSVAKLVKELTEEEKIVQRSIGWLAQEDKINIESTDRVETVTLK